jgi:anti-sigma factor RsiW
MSCSPFDLRDFLLQELTAPAQRQVEDHVQTCVACRQELDRLRITQTALSSLVDEQIPQRIAFVSDPVFEPSPWRRGWAALWTSGSRLVFASAAMLSVALIVSPMLRRAPAAAPTVQTISDTEIRQRIDAGVTRAVTDIEAQYRTRTEQLVKDIEKRDTDERHVLQASYEDEVDRNFRQLAKLKHDLNQSASVVPGEPQ